MGSRRNLVTLGFGGNDVGFGKIVSCLIAEAALDRGANLGRIDPLQRELVDRLTDVDGCRVAVSLGLDGKRAALRTTLTELYTDIRRPGNGLLAEGGRVLAIGYPRMFPDDPPDSCSLGTSAGIGRDNMVWINEFVDGLNALLRDTASENGVDYVDVSDVVATPGPDGVRHDFCVDADAERWMNRFIGSDLRRSMHPKPEYHAAVADRVLRCWRDRSACAPLDTNPWADLRPGPVAAGAPGMTPSLVAALDLPECDDDQDGPGQGVSLERITTGDLTGDGVAEAVVAVECTPLTSSWPEHVLVLDGARGPRTATRLGAALTDGRLVATSGRPLTHLHELAIAVDGPTVTLSGDARSSRIATVDPADFRYDQTFTWRDGRWDAGPVGHEPVGDDQSDGPTRDGFGDGTHHARPATADTVLDTLTFDVVQYFGPADAARECVADGVTPIGAWCSDHYVRNDDTVLRILPLAADASILVLDGTAQPVPARIEDLDGQLRSGLQFRYQITVQDGQIVSVIQQYEA